MNRLAWATFATTILLASLLYTVVSNRPSEHFALTIGLPVILGLLIGSIYTWLRAIFRSASSNMFWPIIRQGLLIGVVVGSLLYLQGLRVLELLDALLLIGAAILLEIFFQSEKTDLRTPKDE